MAIFLHLASASPSAAATKSAHTRGIGLRRVPGVWTRRGQWAPTNEIADEVADQARVEGRRAGDKQRQRREDEVCVGENIYLV